MHFCKSCSIFTDKTYTQKSFYLKNLKWIRPLKAFIFTKRKWEAYFHDFPNFIYIPTCQHQ